MSQPFKKRLTLGMILMALMMCVAFMLPISSFQTSAQSPSPLGVEPSIFTFTPTAEGECSVRLADKTVESAIIPSKAMINDVEYTVTSIAASGFTSAKVLKKVRLPKTVITIGNSAFANCKELTSITMPAVTTIGTSVFNLCTSLGELIIPKTVTSVGSTILRSTSTQVYVRASEAETQEYGWASNWNANNTNQNVEYSSQFTPAIEYKEVIEQPLTRSTYDATPVGYIVDENQPFSELDNYANVYIPAIYNGLPVIGIEQHAFEFNDIQSLTIGYAQDPIYIKSYAFYGLTADKITINRAVDFSDLDDSMTNEINSAYVFDNATASTIILPDNITALGVNMFYDCLNLTDIHFTTPQSGLSREQEEAISDSLTSTKSVTLPSTMTTIEDEAFSGITGIENLYIPNSVVNVGSKILVNWGITNDKQVVSINYEHESDLPLWNETTKQGWNPTWKTSCNPIILEFQGEYSIVYHLNNGQHSGNPESYTPQDQITLNDATREGYTFDGWYEDAAFTGERVYGIQKGSSEDKEFYAKWIANSYNVAYNTNKPVEASGTVTGVTDSSNHIYDTSSALRSNGFSLTGWSFTGWNTKADGSGTAYGNQATVTNLASENNAVITLYAQWSPNNYQIAYSGNKPNNASGLLSGSMSNSSHVYDTEKTLTENSYSLIGWHFIGWNTKADGSGTNYANGAQVVNLGLTQNSIVTLYAQWIQNEYTVTYNGNKPNSASNILTGSTANSTHKFDTSKQLSINGFELPGWRFVGWNTQSNGSGQTYSDGQSVLNLTTFNNATVTLFAQWETNGYYVEYIGNKPSSASGSISGSMSRSSHAFDSTSQLAQNEFKLTGWHFTGWNTAANGSGNSYTDAQDIYNLTSENGGIITLYAQWSPNQFTIAFNANKPNGASNSVQNSMTGIPSLYDTAETLPANAYELLGWRFLNWNTKADGSGISYTNGQSVMNLTTENGVTVVLYAQWKSNGYDINYNSNKPSTATGTITGSIENSHHEFDRSKNLTSNSYSLQGWHFLYWTTNADGTGTKYTDSQSVMNLTSQNDVTITLYAQWEPNTYKVIYNSNAPTTTDSVAQGSTTTSTFLYDTTYSLSKNGYTLKGYIFANWSDESGNVYADEQSIANLRESGEITLYANWTPITYTIVYNRNLPSDTGSISGSTANSYHQYDKAQTLNPNGVILEKWKFNSWNTKPNGTGTRFANKSSVVNLTDVDGATITLYAQWTKYFTITFDGSQGYCGYENGTTPVPFDEPTRYTQLNETIRIPFIIYRGYKFTWHEYINGVPTGAVYLEEASYVVKNNATLKAIRAEKTLDECQTSPTSKSYEIYTVNQLNQIRNQPNGGFDRGYWLQNPLTVENWVPIPHFRGSFSGNDHLITIRSIASSTTQANMGAFINTNEGHLQYVNVETNIELYSTSVQSIGIIVGQNLANGYLIECFSYGSVKCYDTTASAGLYGVNNGTVIPNCKNYASISRIPVPDDGHCVATGTLITLADGSQVPVESLTGNEMLLVWNLQTGKFDYAPILFIDNDPIGEYQVINLYFSDGTQVKVIYEHGFWDSTLNRYVYIGDDAAQYIGHYFNKQFTTQSGELAWKTVQLVNVEITIEPTAAWSPVTYQSLCYYVNGMLSMPGNTEAFVNIFEVDSATMQYDQAAFMADIETYGLFTYEEFFEHIEISKDVFDAFGGQYLKVAMGKGLTNWETISALVQRYADFLG